VKKIENKGTKENLTQGDLEGKHDDVKEQEERNKDSIDIFIWCGLVFTREKAERAKKSDNSEHEEHSRNRRTEDETEEGDAGARRSDSSRDNKAEGTRPWRKSQRGRDRYARRKRSEKAAE